MAPEARRDSLARRSEDGEASMKLKTSPSARRRKHRPAQMFRASGRRPLLERIFGAEPSLSSDQQYELLKDDENGARSFALNSLRMLFLINGGAMLAILTFAGTLASAGLFIPGLQITAPLFHFGSNLVLLTAMSLVGAVSEILRASVRSNDIRWGQRTIFGWFGIKTLLLVWIGGMSGAVISTYEGFYHAGPTLGVVALFLEGRLQP